jgi:AGCS family alanine or glycine:cation symporter
MKKTTLFSGGMVGSIASGSALAQTSFDAQVNAIFSDSTGWFVSLIFAPLPGTSFPWIVLWLVVAAIVFTLYFRFIQVRAFTHAFSLVKGDYCDPKDKGEVSHFQALATALSGTIGLGNIAGVAVAVGIGGPGATFWMIVAGLLGMATKFTECTLAVKYRNEYPDGTVSGGPMYYMTKGFAERNLRGGKIMAIVFSIFCIGGSLGAGNMFQANQAHAQLVSITGGADSLLSGNGWITGLILALALFAVIIGGIKSIAKVTAKVVPLMGLLYIIASLVVLAINYDRIGWAFGQIFAGAFTDVGIAGGFVGALIQGFRRAAFSNEAGVGSAAIAHSAVRTKEPVSEGIVALLEPFIDTVVICTMTALVITISGVLVIDQATGMYVVNEAGHIATTGGATGVELTSTAFAQGLSWFPYVLTLVVVLFAFSTMISWSYYGLKAWTYLVGEGKRRELAFKLGYCGFVIVGAVGQLGAVIDFSDSMLFAMAVVNIIALYFLLPVVKRELQSYMARLDSGEIRKFGSVGEPVPAK